MTDELIAYTKQRGKLCKIIKRDGEIIVEEV
jgi:ribosomal protein L36